MSTKKYINAGAGSGKTYKLTHKLADMLVPVKDSNVKPIDPSRIILTTFTKAAAADFVRKAREVLINEKNMPSKAAELDSALIGTVHSVCETFVKKYWYRLGLTLPLNVISEEDKNLYISRTAENVASDDDIKFFSRFALDYEMNADFWKEYLREIVNLKYSFGVGGFSESCETSCNDIEEVFSVDASDKIPVLDSFLKTIDQGIEEWNREKEAKGQKPQLLGEQKEARALLGGAALYKKALKVYKWSVENKDKSTGFWKKSITPDVYDMAKDAASRVLLSKSVGVDCQECVRKLFKLAGDWEQEYQKFKEENSLLDFNDQEQKFLRILYEDGFEDVREDIRKSYDVMMVDEFQDSNPVQIRIFRKLMELVNETVFVGDRKQAIFGFRGTESTLVEEFINDFSEAEQESLKESYRSRPELVEAANDVFCNAFNVKKLPVYPDDPGKPYDKVSLKPVRSENEKMGPASQFWFAPLKSSRAQKNDYVAIGKKIKEIVDSGNCMVYRDKDDNKEDILEPIQYRDIAILLRNGTLIPEIAQAFREAEVPVSIQEKEFINWAEYQLILSLIRYIIDEDDKCAKADILHLLNGLPTQEIIRDTVNNLPDGSEQLFERLGNIRKRLSVLSVSEIVESLVLELDMYGSVGKWGLSETRTRNIGFIINLARQYEQMCLNMNVAPTLPGYISYTSGYKAEGHIIDRTNTVKVLTCHSSKGLEWPMVILDELDSLNLDEQNIYKKEFGGVRPYRNTNIDQVLLHVFPKIMSKSSKDYYGAAPNLPEPVMARVGNTSFFKYVTDRKIEEEKRLLYVGFTRAKDYLVTLGNSKSTFSWPLLCGAGVLSNQRFEWHPQHQFSFVDLTPIADEPDNQTNDEPTTLHAWTIPSTPTGSDKYISPSLSGHQSLNPVTLTEVFRGERMLQNIQEEDGNEALCGTCIHHIFAAYDPDRNREEMVGMAGRIIKGMGLTKEFPSPDSVIDSAAQFFCWLRKRYGEGTPLHELPVVMRQEDGTIIRGDMDLVWDLPDGKCVLVDFKSYHTIEDFLDPKARGAYAGYAPQLKAYQETLEAANGQEHRKVQDVLIYYFVQGRVIRFEF
jgi:ATP-dependent exoDNAse (exonuclease V) beta subunit